MDKSELSKIVSTPNETSWSQAYNAGKLYAVLALEREAVEQEEQIETELDLGILGKEILESLESEFFTLEKKDLEGIKGTVEKSVEKIPSKIKVSFVVAAENQNILYTAILGKGKIDLKRGDKIGTILISDSDEIKTASGFLQNNDILILQTPQFSELVPSETLSSSIDDQTPSEIAEILAPIIHKSEQGAAASIIVKYKDEVPPKPVEVPPEPQPQAEGLQTKVPSLKLLNSYFYEVKNLIENRRISVSALSTLPHSKRVILTVGIILLVVFLGTTFLAVKRETDKRNKELFAKVYVEAEKKYGEGQSLLGLNQALARDSFQSAKKTLEEGLPKFSQGGEKKKTEELLAKVNKAISESSGVNKINPVEVQRSESKLLSFELDHKDGLYFAKDDKNLYFVSKNSVSSDKKTLIKNNGDWKDVGGLGTFFGNLYVLDKAESAIVKFVATPTEFGKADYFTGAKPDLSGAQGLAIDGSIYVLLKDGTILKFTRGKQDNFKVQELVKPLLNPTRIYTDPESNIYILDNGNSRVVVLGRDGKYLSQYQASILKTASDFDIQESAKKILVLSGSKVFRIDIK